MSPGEFIAALLVGEERMIKHGGGRVGPPQLAGPNGGVVFTQDADGRTESFVLELICEDPTEVVSVSQLRPSAWRGSG